MDDTTAFVKGQNKKLPGIAEKLLKSVRRAEKARVEAVKHGSLQKIREDTLVEVVELEAHLLVPTDVTGIVNVLAKNACNGSGYRFAFIKRKGSMRVCEKIWKETTRSCKSSSRA